MGDTIQCFHYHVIEIRTLRIIHVRENYSLSVYFFVCVTLQYQLNSVKTQFMDYHIYCFSSLSMNISSSVTVYS